MMKKLFISVLLICMIASLTGYAKSPESSDYDLAPIQTIIFTNSGECLEITVPKIIISQRGTITGQVAYRYRDSGGIVQWTAILTGSFTFNGSSATCTAASCITSVQQGNWHETYNHAYPSGNTAQADITMVRKVLFVTVQTETAHLVLSCDANGNLS